MKFFLPALAICALIVAPALADTPLLPARDGSTGFFAGTDVLRLCAAHDENQLIECLGYLEGVGDAMVEARLTAHQPVCIPTGTAVDKFQDAAIAYMIKFPAERVKDGATVVEAAINAAYPCPK